MEFFQILAEQWRAQNTWEVIAVALSIAYIILAARASSWCWPCAFVSTAIFSVLFFDTNLLQEAALNIYYLIIAVYGWYHWRYSKNESSDKEAHELPISRWSVKRHLKWIGIVTIVALISGFFSDSILKADMPYINGFTVWFAVFTTYLVAQKVLENWYYWLVLNPISFYIFYQQELYVTCLLMVVYFVMTLYGIYEWKKLWRQQNNEVSRRTSSAV
ncbi:nicotinamide riboside transporter PnuC [Pleionea sediminis]|uniref:nicotinamide riboside transporter PnuC n=1 Tax=Pleionea sediminis TaxID=2569479 RepID=UPI0011859D3F|nr:nicotinamide riboside transporter PnuC [Pleionea sediminis]